MILVNSVVLGVFWVGSLGFSQQVIILLLVFCFFLLFQVPSFIVSFLLRELPLDILVVDSLCFPSSQNVDFFFIPEGYFCIQWKDWGKVFLLHLSGSSIVCILRTNFIVCFQSFKKNHTVLEIYCVSESLGFCSLPWSSLGIQPSFRALNSQDKKGCQRT